MNDFSVTKAEPVTLHDGSKAPRAFYTRLKQAAELGIQKMRAGVPTTFRKICGNGIWLSLNGSEVSLAGLCGVTMASRGELPIVLLEEKDARNARLYVLK